MSALEISAVNLLRQLADRLERELLNQWGNPIEGQNGLSEYDQQLLELARHTANLLEERLLEE